MSVTTTHFEDVTGRPPISVQALFEANEDALLGAR
jgi:hypothetical protein